MADVMNKFGLTTVLWSANCGKAEGTTRENIANYVLSNAKPGSIILMHDVEEVELLALPGIIDALRAKGYGFATIAELQEAEGGKSRERKTKKLGLKEDIPPPEHKINWVALWGRSSFQRY